MQKTKQNVCVYRVQKERSTHNESVGERMSERTGSNERMNEWEKIMDKMY